MPEPHIETLRDLIEWSRRKVKYHSIQREAMREVLRNYADTLPGGETLDEPVDIETLADLFDGAGYPYLAEELHAHIA